MPRLVDLVARRPLGALTVLCLVFVALGFRHQALVGDWVYVEMGARTLAHHRTNAATGSPLHLYADIPSEQMGPPSLLLAVPLQYLPIRAGERVGVDLLCLAVIPLLWLLQDTARALGADRAAARVLAVGVVVVPVWCTALQAWGHPDDVLALLLVAAASRAIARGRGPVLVGVLLGTAAAAKPWAAIVVPLLFVLPRVERPRGILAFLGAALIWWFPFIAAAPQTVHALGSFSLPITAHTTWSMLGMAGTRAGWQRSVQLFGGVVLSALVVRLRSWRVVPLVAFLWRVTVDPYSWPYYVLGPLVGAALWDLVRPRLRGLPAWSVLVPSATIAVASVEFALLRWLPSFAAPARLALFVVVLALVVRDRPRGSVPSARPSAAVESEPALA